jgi:signal transduction histidine kinase
MMTYNLEGIINALQSGNPDAALKIAKSALAGLPAEDTGPETLTDYPIFELVVDDARKMVEKAVQLCRDCGRDVALAEFSKTDGNFVKGEQYVFVLSATGQMLAHGVNGDYIGKDFLHVVDFDGRRFIAEIIRKAGEKDTGWTEYKWINPKSGDEEHKTVYFQKHDGMIICSGIYQGK